MKIILNQDVNNLGEEGDVVVVKDGYARNFLLPTGAAVVYNKANEAVFKSRAEAIEKRKIEKRAQSASMKERLDNLTISIVISAGESGKLFGSVTAAMIQDALAKQGIDVERKRIEVATHAIKMVGDYTVRVHLYENESALVKVKVESEAAVRAAAKAAAEAEKKAAAEAKKAEKEAAAKAEAEAVAEVQAAEKAAVILEDGEKPEVVVEE